MGPAAAALAALIDDPMFAKSVAAAAITSGAAITNDIPHLRPAQHNFTNPRPATRRQGFRSYNNLETGCRTFLKRASANPIVSAHMLRKSCWSRNEPARAVTGAAALGGLQDQRRPGIG
ncbi:Uncharacterised protein [Mycobacterium tuberculosis]|nr:Uncharacterised protein [Mycobacterium tuberculosis]